MLARLASIALARSAGFTLDEVARLAGPNRRRLWPVSHGSVPVDQLTVGMSSLRDRP